MLTLAALAGLSTWTGAAAVPLDPVRGLEAVFWMVAGVSGLGLATGYSLPTLVPLGNALTEVMRESLVGSTPVPVLLISSGAHCPTCAQTVEGAAVRCPRCSVVSHSDCWSFQGGCGIYGCRSSGHN